jgi:flagellar basal-body rod protein FlgC
MSFFETIDMASTGLSAQRIRINVISSNMANANTTRTQDGGPYRKKNVVFKEVMEGMHKGGVQVDRILPDFKPPQLRYMPGHPDANEEGYVAFPNINPIEEMVNMLEAARSYEANVTIVNTAKQLAQQAIAIGQS